MDPTGEIGDFCVHSGVVGSRAAGAPANNSAELLPTHEWTSGVALASIFSAFAQKSSANHGVKDSTFWIRPSAFGIVNVRNCDLQEIGARCATFGCTTPSYCRGKRGRIKASWRKGHWLDTAVELKWLINFHERNVVVINPSEKYK